MKAAAFTCVGAPLEIVDRPDPEPTEGQVVLRVGRCGICGTDLHMTAGHGLVPAHGEIIGHEFAGEVVALGKGISNLKLGDRVTALPVSGCGACAACLAGEPVWCARGMQYLGGGYAQYALAGAAECVRLPSGLSDADGALVEPLAVALHGVRMTQGLGGANVCVLGAGPIGLGALFWARRFGAARVDVVETNPERAEIALAMGASSVRAPAASEPLAPQLPRPDAPDIVFECVGKPGLLAAAVAEVRPRGTVISLGFCMAPEQILAAAAAQREVTLKFPIIYSLGDYQMTVNALDAGHVEARAMITETVSLAQLPTVFEALRAPGANCKVMIDPWRDA